MTSSSNPPRRRPRAVSLTLPNSRQPSLVLNGENYTLRNFSREGIGIWVPPPIPFGLALGSQISGDVVIGQEIFPVQLEIKHHSQGVAGFRFVKIPPQLQKTFEELMRPATYACQIEVHPESGKEDSAVGLPRLWYAGSPGTELLVWFNPFQRMIHAIQICWPGKWVYREKDKKPQTGFLKDGTDGGGRKVDPDGLIPPPITHNKTKGTLNGVDLSEPDYHLVHEAALFLTSLPAKLPGRLLWQFLEMGEQVYLPELGPQSAESGEGEVG